MKYKIMKKNACLLLAAAMLVTSPFGGTSILSQAAEAGAETGSEVLKDPVITLHNFSMQMGKTSYFTENPEGNDINFGPGGSQINDAYIEYNYIDQVRVDAIDLIGWWPKDQGIREMGVFYYSEGEWKSALDRTEIPWVTVSGNGSSEECEYGEKLRVTLPESVKTTKIRIQIYSGYTSWGSGKINMKLLAPIGEVLRDLRGIYERIEASRKYLDGVLLGSRPGEFPKDAAEALRLELQNAEEAIQDPKLTEEELKAQVDRLEQCRVTFEERQNPAAGEDGLPAVSLENLEVIEGREQYLGDRQMSTGVSLQKGNGEEVPGIVIDYGNAVKKLESLTLVSDTPEKAAGAVKIQAFADGGWKDVAEAVLTWKGTIPNYEGKTVTLPETAASSRFRIQLLETGGETEWRMNELIWSGETQVKTASLQELAQKAERLLAKAAGNENRFTDRVWFRLRDAGNADRLSMSGQADVDALYQALSEAVVLLENSIKPEVSVNTGALDQAIANAKKLEASKYTRDSFEKVSKALAAALGADRSNQTLVDQAARNLQAAMNGLVLQPQKPADPALNSIYKGKDYFFRVKKNRTVSVVKPVKKKASAVIPKTVSIQGASYRVTAIEKNAFKNNKKLKSVSCGANVALIGESAFAGCRNLRKVTLGAKVTSIGKKAFWKDRSLKSITVKTKGLKKVGKSAFDGTPAKASVHVPNKLTKKYRRMFWSAGISRKAKIK